MHNEPRCEIKQKGAMGETLDNLIDVVGYQKDLLSRLHDKLQPILENAPLGKETVDNLLNPCRGTSAFVNELTLRIREIEDNNARLNNILVRLEV